MKIGIYQELILISRELQTIRRMMEEDNKGRKERCRERCHILNFTYEELARLNSMIGAALMSGRIEFDEISKSIHEKISDEIYAQMQRKTEKEMEEI